MGLQEYNRKRNFKITPEPTGRKIRKGKNPIFVIQRHAARRLHYDFRLELDGVLKSWAVPKGPSLDPKDKRLAVQTEDHPMDYASFEGVIPKGEYGAGTVVIWDKGTWQPKGDPHEGLEKGSMHFFLNGEKLSGEWILVRTRSSDPKEQWLLIKRSDKAAQPGEVRTATKTVKSNKRSAKKKAPELGLEETANKSVIQSLSPQLAQLATDPPNGEEWLHEIKFDGYRTLTHIEAGKIELLTRASHNWTDKYKIFLPDLKKLPVKTAWLDGEIVCLDENGVSDFQLLQEGLKGGRCKAMRYYLFDLLELNGEDLREKSLVERKELLKELMSQTKTQFILYSEHFETTGEEFLAQACKMGLEGIVSKEKTSPYLSGRVASWIKTKCDKSQEFVIGGYTAPKNTREGFGSLVVGYYNEHEKLVYAGRVGTGFDIRTARDLMARFSKLKTKNPPFDERLPKLKEVTWLRPQLVAEVNFLNWTRDEVLRHPSFKGLRLDKPAEEVRRETAQPVSNIPKYSFHVSNPDKILIPSKKVRKIEIAQYFEAVQDWILPHLVNRPLAVLRCPDGIKKECFFQKKSVNSEGIFHRRLLGPNDKEQEIMYIENAQGLSALCQAGVIEIHPWGTHVDHYLYPDLIVMDLDPGPGVTIKQVAEAALQIRDLLENLGLKSFVKVSGGKGYHVHLPIAPDHTWETIKAFTKTLALHMTQQNSKLFTINMNKSKRNRRIFIDYLRNGYGATSIATYGLRARDEASVALPISWDEVLKVNPAEFNLREVPEILKSRKDPWADYFDCKQKVEMLASKV